MVPKLGGFGGTCSPNTSGFCLPSDLSRADCARGGWVIHSTTIQGVEIEKV